MKVKDYSSGPFPPVGRGTKGMEAMKVITHVTTVAALVLASTAAAVAEEAIVWQQDFAAAKQLAAQTNRLVLVHFWAPWCRPCMKLEREVFAQPQVGSSVMTNYVPVKLNADHHGALARAFGVKSIPTDVIVAPDGRVVTHFNSPSSATTYVAQMNQLASVHRPALARYAQKPNEPTLPAPASPPPAPPATPAPPEPAQERQVPLVQPAVPAPSAGTTSGQLAVGQDPAEQPKAPTGVAMQHTAPALVGPNDRYAAPQLGPRYADHGGAATAGPPIAPGPAATGAAPQQRPPVGLPPGAPQPGLDGYCPVTLVETQKWLRGDPAWGAIHRGRTYLFSSREYQQKFLADPDRYSPALSGDDPVLAIDDGQNTSGHRRHGVFFDNRIYLFSNEETLARFSQSPDRYVEGVRQAMHLTQHGGQMK